MIWRRAAATWMTCFTTPLDTNGHGTGCAGIAAGEREAQSQRDGRRQQGGGEQQRRPGPGPGLPADEEGREGEQGSQHQPGDGHVLPRHALFDLAGQDRDRVLQMGSHPGQWVVRDIGADQLLLPGKQLPA